jgi:dTDP-4-dehydrorhamnose reductase
MRILVVGANGMLGTDLVEELEHSGHEVRSLDLPEIDITNPESVAKIPAGEFGPFDWCFNCAAYTAVDKAESESQLAYEVNTLGAGYLARACMMAGIKFLHVSTDFVFDGSASEPYTEEAKPNPLGVYGQSKLEGERSVMNANQHAVIARTAWLYGANGPSFPRTMIKAFEAGKSLRVVADQIGCPTYTADLARVLVDLMNKNAFPGIYHTAGPDAMSWHEFATLAIQEYARQQSLPDPQPITPINTEDWRTPAKRPKYSVLSFEKAAQLGVEPMRPVRESLANFVSRLGP